MYFIRQCLSKTIVLIQIWLIRRGSKPSATRVTPAVRSAVHKSHLRLLSDRRNGGLRSPVGDKGLRGRETLCPKMIWGPVGSFWTQWDHHTIFPYARRLFCVLRSLGEVNSAVEVFLISVIGMSRVDFAALRFLVTTIEKGFVLRKQKGMNMKAKHERNVLKIQTLIAKIFS